MIHEGILIQDDYSYPDIYNLGCAIYRSEKDNVYVSTWVNLVTFATTT